MGNAELGRPARSHPARGGHRAVHRHSLRSVPAGDEPRAIAPGYRVWLHVDGVQMFGPGMHELLRRVEETGSLHQAAKLMGMSYNKAWRAMRRAEDRLGVKLLERRAGGRDGGGSVLTEEGAQFVERFRAFLDEADADLARLYRKYFGDAPFAQPVDSSRE